MFHHDSGMFMRFIINVQSVAVCFTVYGILIAKNVIQFLLIVSQIIKKCNILPQSIA